MSNKLTAAIAAKYFGCEVRTSNAKYKMIGLGRLLIHIEIEKNKKFDYVPYADCQLLLTPLEKISEEDAIELARFFFYCPKQDVPTESDFNRLYSQFINQPKP